MFTDAKSYNNIAVHYLSVTRKSTVIIMSPEFYSDCRQYQSEKWLTSYYVVDDRVDFVLTSFNRDFSDPYEVARDMASLVKELKKQYDKVVIMGRSKGGAINIAMLKFLDDSDYNMMLNVAVPYEGTILAMPDEIWKRSKFFYFLHRLEFDGGLADVMIEENSAFLKGLDYAQISPYKFINFTAQLGRESFVHDWTIFDLKGLGCFYVDWVLNLKGDGIVPFSSQATPQIQGFKTVTLCASHQSAHKVAIKYFLDYYDR